MKESLRQLFTNITKLIEQDIPPRIESKSEKIEISKFDRYRYGTTWTNHFSKQYFTQHGIPSLVEYLNLNPNIQTATIGLEVDVNIDQAIPQLATCQHLTTLNIESHCPPFEADLTNLKHMQSLTALGLPGQIKKESLESLQDIKLKAVQFSSDRPGEPTPGLGNEKTDTFSGHPSVTELTFYACGINDDKALSKFKFYDLLETLMLKRNRLTTDNFLTLSKILSLTTLHLSSCGLTYKAISHLHKFENLTDLDLSGNSLTNKSLEIWPPNLRLTQLNLAYSYLSEWGIENLMKKNKALKVLNLYGNDVGNYGASLLSQACYLEALESLDVGRNSFDHERACLLMQSKTGLRSLNLEKMTKNGDDIARLSFYCPNLTELNLSKCEVSTKGAFFLAINPYLLNLTLMTHNIGFLGALALALSTKLIKLRISMLEGKGNAPHLRWLFFWGNQNLNFLARPIETSLNYFFDPNHKDYNHLNNLDRRNARLQRQHNEQYVKTVLLNWLTLPYELINIISNYNDERPTGVSYPYRYDLFYNSLTSIHRDQLNQALPIARQELRSLETEYETQQLL